MQVLINRVMTAAGYHVNPWIKGEKSFSHWKRNDLRLLASLPKRFDAAKMRKREVTYWLAPEGWGEDKRGSYRLDDMPKVEVYRILKDGKLVHVSRTLDAAFREIAWRDWCLGVDGVEIVTAERPNGTRWGHGRPLRYVGPWPQAKNDEFKCLYESGMSFRDLEDHFDSSTTNLGNKVKSLGCRPRK